MTSLNADLEKKLTESGSISPETKLSPLNPNQSSQMQPSNQKLINDTQKSTKKTSESFKDDKLLENTDKNQDSQNQQHLNAQKGDLKNMTQI